MPGPPFARLFQLLGPAFVISRAGEHPRKQRIRAALGEAGVQAEWFDATMGDGLSPEELAAIYDEQAALNHKTISRRLHPSHIGCAWSHKRLYQEILRRELPAAVVLEDDALPLPAAWGAEAEQAVAALPPDWDLLYLGLRGHRLPPRGFRLKLYLFLPLARLFFPWRYRLKHAEHARLYLRPYAPGLYRAGYHQGTHAYAVSRRGAGQLLRHIGRINAPADVMLATLVIEGKLNAFALRKDLFGTTGAASQIVSALPSAGRPA